jgi:hypothetical protein
MFYYFFFNFCAIPYLTLSYDIYIIDRKTNGNGKIRIKNAPKTS